MEGGSLERPPWPWSSLSNASVHARIGPQCVVRIEQCMHMRVPGYPTIMQVEIQVDNRYLYKKNTFHASDPHHKQ